MPLLKIHTNQSLDEGQKTALLAEASRDIAAQLGKPESYVMVAFEHNSDMLFAGTGAPLAYLELKSIGLPAASTPTLSAQLCKLMQQHLGIPAERVYVEFADAPRHLWGWNGGTF